MPKALTDALVRTVKPPERGQSTITDSTLRNFALRLSQGGTKTFVVSLGGQAAHHRPLSDNHPLGSPHRRQTPLGRKELGKITPERVPFDDAVSDFLKDCKTRVRPRTLKNYTDCLRLLPFNRRSVASLTPRELVVIFNNQVPSQREQLHRVARNFFRWYVGSTSSTARRSVPCRCRPEGQGREFSPKTSCEPSGPPHAQGRALSTRLWRCLCSRDSGEGRSPPFNGTGSKATPSSFRHRSPRTIERGAYRSVHHTRPF